jgi:hypothetical protein
VAVLGNDEEEASHTVEEAEAVLLGTAGAGLLGTAEEGLLGNAAAVASWVAEEEAVHRIATEEAHHDCCCKMEEDDFQVVEALLESHLRGNFEAEAPPCRQLDQAEEE